MITLRKGKDRGHFDHGWLKTFHTFSFGDYHDPRHMAFGPLRVINEDWIQGGEGFPTHGHRDMEIITYVVEGAVAHKDSTQANGIIKPGEVQKMTAGSGIRHSEFNGLKDEATHLYQIWILPIHSGLKPSYQQKDFAVQLDTHEPVLLATQDGRQNTVSVDQSLNLWARRMKPKTDWSIDLDVTRLYWLQVVRGEVKTPAGILKAGDALAIEREKSFLIHTPQGDAEVLFFDMGL